MTLTATTVGDGLLGGLDFRVGKSLQTVYGAVNTSPTFIPLRRKSGKTNKTISYTTDEEVLSDYQGQQQIQDSQELGCTIEASMTKQSIDLMIEAMYAAESLLTNTGTTYASLADGFTVTTTAYNGLSVGDVFWVSGFADATISKAYIVASKGASNKIVTTIAPPATESAGATVTLISNKYKNANNAYYSTLQTRATDLSKAGNLDYHTIYDAIPNACSFEIGETGIVSCTTEYVAEREVSGTAAISGQSYSSATTDAAVSAYSGVVGFFVNGLLASCKVKSLSGSIALNQSADDAAACSKRYTRGAITVTGSLSVRSLKTAPFTWRDYSWAGTRVSMGALLSHGSGQETFIDFPRAVVIENEMDDGNNAIANSKASFACEGDATKVATMQIFRNW
jgi:hypothetical protein